jgi:putative tryptophan/tyrosine transport system substrate-binding protein
MVVLFTDFGLQGPYPGQMKAVLYQMAPAAPVIDLFADAPVGNPKASAYLLASYAEWFPAGTVFLSVIDPGVGGTRPPIILEADGRWYVGPGNGLFELVERRANVILASASQSVIALQRVTSSVPIVFASVIDPVGAGFISTMARPGGNTTGFTAFEYSISGKWLDLLRELAPNVKRVAVLRDPSYATGIGQFAAIQSAASSSGMELSAFDLRDTSAVERALAGFSREPNGGVITTASGGAVVHRELIISFTTQYRLPNVCPFRYFAASGGLASYGPNTIDPFPQAAGYVDRILKGEKPADLTVQAPTKYELVINLKTAKAIGLTIPQPLLARADEVIE